MSLAIVVLLCHPSGERDIIVASERRMAGYLMERRSPDGAVLDKGPLTIFSDDYRKSERLGPRVFIAYIGKNSLYYEQVLADIQGKLREGGDGDISSITAKLHASICDIYRTPRSQRYVKELGLTDHLFLLGGSAGADLKLYLFLAKNNFETDIKTMGTQPGVHFALGGPDPETQAFAEGLCRTFLDRPRTSDEVAAHLAGVIRETAKRSELVNDRVDIRRLSRGFELKASPAEKE